MQPLQWVTCLKKSYPVLENRILWCVTCHSCSVFLYVSSYFNAPRTQCGMHGIFFVFMQIHTILEIRTLENVAGIAEMSWVVPVAEEK